MYVPCEICVGGGRKPSIGSSRSSCRIWIFILAKRAGFRGGLPTVIVFVLTTNGLNAHVVEFGLNVHSYYSDEGFIPFLGGQSTGKGVNLMTDQDFIGFNHTNVEVTLMNSMSESHLVDENVHNQSFPECTCFGIPM